MHTWQGHVRDYELDIQQVVNNAVYLNYFEHARHLMLRDIGIDFVTWHQQQYDFMLVETNIKYLKPLKSRDYFTITSTIQRQGRVRIFFEQNLKLQHSNELMTSACCTAICLDAARGRACMPKQLVDILDAANACTKT